MKSLVAKSNMEPSIFKCDNVVSLANKISQSLKCILTAIVDSKPKLRFIRQIEFNSPIGYYKFKNWKLTPTMTVMPNINVDLITATPETIK
ncbi:hypothetical protein [Chitinophaga sp.]|uniref:hypothetical protein n=1 Tax=Chitinophaga sp. TaxID=1869181 RepID=UPI0031D20CDB